MKPVMIENAAQAVVGVERLLTADEIKELRKLGQLDTRVNDLLANQMADGILRKHRDDVELSAMTGQLSHSDRRYRLEIVTFSRREWLAHIKEWDMLEAERDALKTRLDEINT